MKTSQKWIAAVVAVLVISAALIYLHELNIYPDAGTAFSSDTAWPGKRDLWRAMRESRKMLLVYATGDTAAAKAYLEFATDYKRNMRWFEIEIKPDTSVLSAELSNTPLFLLGARFRAARVADILTDLPVHFDSEHFEIPDFFESEPNDVYLLSRYPNPLNRQMPLSIITAVSDTQMVSALPEFGNLFRQAGDFRVFREGQGIVLGFFSQQPAGPWTLDKARSRNYVKHERATWQSEHFAFVMHGEALPAAEQDTLAAKYEWFYQRLQAQVGGAKLPSAKIEVNLYEHAEDKGLLTGNTDFSHVDLQQNRIYLIHNEYLDGLDFLAPAHLLLTKALGPTKSLALSHGLAVYFSNFGEMGYQFWAKKFYQTENVDKLDALFDPEIYGQESYLFMLPQAGSFVAFLIEKYGWEKFEAIYQSWPESGLPADLAGETTQLENGWYGFLANLDPGPDEWQSKREPVQHPVFQKGFCYAHEGYQIYNGYMSRESEHSIAKMHKLGANWISITPFGYLENRNQPGYFHFSFGAGAENDESVVTAFYQAKEQGVHAVLKPHILMRGGDWGWPGEIKMTSETDWQAFFDYYWRWMRHYAFLAEAFGFDMLCIGTELVHTTTPEHEKQWREIIRKARQIYSGPIVYAANWGEEFERITFWDALDYISLDCYYPLCQNENATDAELAAGARAVAERIGRVAKKYNQPVILTEVGFPSLARNWLRPHEDPRDAQASVQDQVRCYRAIFEAFWQQPWFHGMYWWKWPTYMEHGGEENKGFTPCGKPAEEVVKEWYQKERV